MAIAELQMASFYDRSFRSLFDSFSAALWERPELITALHPAQARELLAALIELACQCSHARNIDLGRAGIWALPKDWVLDHIETVAEPILPKDDDWEYRRLMEVYERLDHILARKFALRCLAEEHPEIKAVGEDYLAKLTGPADPIIQ